MVSRLIEQGMNGIFDAEEGKFVANWMEIFGCSIRRVGWRYFITFDSSAVYFGSRVQHPIDRNKIIKKKLYFNPSI